MLARLLCAFNLCKFPYIRPDDKSTGFKGVSGTQIPKELREDRVAELEGLKLAWSSEKLVPLKGQNFYKRGIAAIKLYEAKLAMDTGHLENVEKYQQFTTDTRNRVILVCDPVYLERIHRVKLTLTKIQMLRKQLKNNIIFLGKSTKIHK